MIDNTDFVRWVESTFQLGDPHLILPGCHVTVNQISNPVGLTAEQAVYLTEHLRRLASVPVEVCEHGVREDQWCAACNREYRVAALRYEQENQ